MRWILKAASINDPTPNTSGVIFFDGADSDNDDYTLLEAIFTEGVNTTGSISLKVPLCNIGYNLFNEMTTLILLYCLPDSTAESSGNPITYATKPLWVGRVYSINTDIDSIKTIVVEGAMGIFNDTCVRFFTNQEGPEAQLTTYHSVARRFIQDHNSLKGNIFEFDVGLPPGGSGWGDIATVNEFNCPKTLEMLYSLAESSGGYIWCDSYESNGEYTGLQRVKFYNDVKSANPIGVIEFGTNLLTLDLITDSDKIATRLIPLGKILDGEDAPITISDVTPNGEDYVDASQTYIDKYGIIEMVHTWENVSTPSRLYTKAQNYVNRYLNRLHLIVSLNAVDLAYISDEYNLLQSGYYVTVNSPNHGIRNRNFLITSTKHDLLNPVNDEVTISGDIKKISKMIKNNTQTSL